MTAAAARDKPAAAEPVVEKTTSYHVFTVDTNTGVLTPVGDPAKSVPAANDLAAIRAVTKAPGSFVAIPVRSLRYRTRHIETLTKDKWS